MDEQKHWDNKVTRGKGTLKDFCKEYDLVNGSEEQFAVASTPFPTGDKDDKGFMKFEWVIFYKVSPHPKAQQPDSKPQQPEVIDLS